MNYTDIMLDLETLGTDSNSAILSMGAVKFNIQTGEIGEKFYCVVDLQSCLNVGLKINGNTFYWWLQQSQSARDAIGYDKKISIKDALFLFNQWIGNDINIRLWGNGSRFDIGILEDAYIACGYAEVPWKFRYERDLRTLVDFAPDIKSKMIFQGIEHNPIDDCMHQIKYCVAIWQKINNQELL